MNVRSNDAIAFLMILQVFSLEDGPVREIWRKIGIPVTIIQTCVKTPIFVDWLKYVTYVEL